MSYENAEVEAAQKACELAEKEWRAAIKVLNQARAEVNRLAGIHDQAMRDVSNALKKAIRKAQRE